LKKGSVEAGLRNTAAIIPANLKFAVKKKQIAKDPKDILVRIFCWSGAPAFSLGAIIPPGIHL